ncbi:MAG TPA: TolC family protein [Pyrinomonadaceae bacterium]|nr:TolC family protein [Pyrinomonadaceae bacterium]
MNFFMTRMRSWCAVACSLTFLVTASNAQDKTKDKTALASNEPMARTEINASAPKPLIVSVLANYYNRQDGVSINQLIERALTTNQDLAATRLNIDRVRARLNQARLRPNPTLEFEQQSGRLVGSSGDGEFSVGASLPIEIYGRREARINVANIEIEASEAEVRNRERVLAANILTNYAEALAALRELDATERLLELDLQTTKFVQIRVNEGETPPLELNLLQAEVERLRARRQLAEGRLESSLTQLKLLAGISFDEPLRLREQLTSATLPALPLTREASVDIALRTRPDIRLAQIEEQVATAGLRLVRAGSRPDLTAYTRYTQGRLTFDAPVPFAQRDRSLTFGVAVGLPIFNKNQGVKAEAEIAIRQAQARREFAERVVRGEILAAYQRFEAASRAVATLENAAIPRSMQNVETFRKVYELGEIKITDLIAEQRRLLDAVRDLTEALTQRYRAQVDLNVALGGNGLLPEQK